MEDKTRFTLNVSRFTLHNSRFPAAALLSGVLLFSAFPPLEFTILIWIALVPIVCIGFFCAPGKSFLYGLLAGLVFWLGSIIWLTRVSFIGWFFISFYCAGFVAFFALIISWWFCHRRLRVSSKPEGLFFDLPVLFGLPAIWVALEYARMYLLTGFPWNLLGISQYDSIKLIQCADFGGVYLVSYLVVMGNTAVSMMILNRRAGILKRAIPLLLFLLILTGVLQYGKWGWAGLLENLIQY